MKLDIVTPGEFLGDIVNDLNARRGHISNIESHDSSLIVRSLLPLAETFGYATSLRSLSQGRAVHSLEFDHYQELPREVAETVTAKRGGRGGIS